MSDSFATQLGAAFRDKDKLIPSVTRHLITAKPSDRRSDCIHPSEMANESWCPRATYYRIAGYTPEPVINSLAMEIVFDIGSEAHSRWQGWFRDMGVLRGMWRCLWCHLLWWDVSPVSCPRCDVGKDLIAYREVPVSNDNYLIAGHMDGDVLRGNGTFTPIECKTIGPGTVRYDAPKLIDKYSYPSRETGKMNVDWQALWNGIRIPFPAHLRQGMLYCFLYEVEYITFIYEPKFITAHPKEFDIKVNFDVVDPLLKKALVVKQALEKERPPQRPVGFDRTTNACKRCPFQKTCWGANNDPSL